ncbi:MAG: aldehyde dehydrogenase family protein [Holophaga sp.]|jgi:aldehyde dehydrogenase (NAD+)
MHVKGNAPAVAHHGKTLIGFNWIGGKEAEGDLPSFDAQSAVDSRDTVGIFPECGERDVERAARAAAAAFGKWSAAPATVRGEFIGRIGEALAAHRAQVAAVITREAGRAPREALAEVQETVDLCRTFRDAARDLRALEAPVGRAGGHSHRRPLGVCAVLAGAASPLGAPAWKLMAALLAGDTVVWKPSVQAPTTAYLLVRCMMDAGLPPGVVNVVNGRGRGECGRALLGAMGRGLFQLVGFCGSDAAGRLVAEAAGRGRTPCALELGGNNPMIVMPDAPLDQAVRGALRGAFTGSGQRRGALGTLLVHRDVAWTFREAFLAGVQALACGNPVTDPEVDCGPMLNARLAQAFQAHWVSGREDGARLLAGGAAWGEDNRSEKVRGFLGKGSYPQPCVWDEVTPEMRLFQAEQFGPTVNLAPVESFEQALAWTARATPLAALYTGNRDWIGRFLRESRAGLVLVNDPGAEWSGNGDAERGPGWETGYTRWQTVAGAAPAAGEAAEDGGAGAKYEPSRWDQL